jgi:hypothetical protein
MLIIVNFLLEEDKKVLCQLLGKLHLPDTVDDDKIRTLKLLMHNFRLVHAFLSVPQDVIFMSTR